MINVHVDGHGEHEAFDAQGDYVAVLVIKNKSADTIATQTVSRGEIGVYDAAQSFALQIARFCKITRDPDETLAQFNVSLDDFMKEVAP